MSIGIVHIFPAIFLCVLHIAGNMTLLYNCVIKCGKESNMAVSKANQRAVNKYKKNNYDRIEITVPKGQRELFRTHAQARGESVNAFINRAIQEAMERDNAAAGATQGHTEVTEEIQAESLEG